MSGWNFLEDKFFKLKVSLYEKVTGDSIIYVDQNKAESSSVDIEWETNSAESDDGYMQMLEFIDSFLNCLYTKRSTSSEYFLKDGTCMDVLYQGNEKKRYNLSFEEVMNKIVGHIMKKINEPIYVTFIPKEIGSTDEGLDSKGIVSFDCICGSREDCALAGVDKEGDNLCGILKILKDDGMILDINDEEQDMDNILATHNCCLKNEYKGEYGIAYQGIKFEAYTKDVLESHLGIDNIEHFIIDKHKQKCPEDNIDWLMSNNENINYSLPWSIIVGEKCYDFGFVFVDMIKLQRFLQNEQFVNI